MKRAILIFVCISIVFATKSQTIAGNYKNTSKVIESINSDETEFSEINLNTSKEINSEVISEKCISTFELQSFKISKEGIVTWESTNEHGSLVYNVEQFVVNKWIKVAEVMGIGSAKTHKYSTTVILNSGENQIRLRQKGNDKQNRYSDVLHYSSPKNGVTYSLTNKNRTLEFSDETYFIIYDPFGDLIKEGSGKSVDISSYVKGNYCLLFDNKASGFKKK